VSHKKTVAPGQQAIPVLGGFFKLLAFASILPLKKR
jgi:hypothetical protein